MASGLLVNLPFGFFEGEIVDCMPITVNTAAEPSPDLQSALEQLARYHRDATSHHDRSLKRGEVGNLAREMWEKAHGWNVDRPVWSARTR